MGKIYILPDRVSNRIAAGEVVERPASVIKELIENSIDAGATEIAIQVLGNGRRLIQVSDDGCGMDYDDAVISLERHSTSKIKNPEDLDSIETLGFRGEALASIASVSRFSMVTRTYAETAATRVEIVGGKLVNVTRSAREPGTTIRVEDLFFNTPARLKFLKSDPVEMRRLIRTVTRYAVCHYKLKFTLLTDNRALLRAATVKTAFEKIYGILGADTAKLLMPFEKTADGVRIYGYCSHTNHRRSNRDGLYFYINSRAVDDRVISSAVTAAYKTLLPQGYYPTVFLFLEMPFDQVDVNVHPTKAEVRFRSPSLIQGMIEEAIRSALIKSSPVLKLKTVDTAELRKSDRRLKGTEGDDIQRRVSNYLSEGTAGNGSQELKPFPDVEAKKEYVVPRRTGDGIENGKPVRGPRDEAGGDTVFSSRAGQTDVGYAPVQPDMQIVGKNYKKWAHSAEIVTDAHPTEFDYLPDLAQGEPRIIGQFLDSFIIIELNADLLLIDQHVAHERVRYEKIKRSLLSNEVESQSLLLPETFEVTPEEDHLIENLSAEFQHLGLEIERFGQRTWIVKSVPSETVSSGEALVREILQAIEDLSSETTTEELRDRTTDEIISVIACQGSVKKNTPLTKEKMEWLVTELFNCSEPYRCPHGRPVIIRIKREELFRKFGRSIHP